VAAAAATITTPAPAASVAAGMLVTKTSSANLDDPVDDMEDGNVFLVRAQRKNKAMYQHYKIKMEQMDEKARSEMVWRA